jgi:hypothetical protein
MKTQEQCEKALSAREKQLENVNDTIGKLLAFKDSGTFMTSVEFYAQLAKDIATNEIKRQELETEIKILRIVLEI